MNLETYPVTITGNAQKLINENIYFQDTAGVSQENGKYNFIPAFLDFESGAIYISSFSDGNPAPIHIYDGLPETLVLSRNTVNKPIKIKQSVVSGFVYENNFYTREQAMQMVKKIEKNY